MLHSEIIFKRVTRPLSFLFQILIQDCVAYLHDCIQSGKKFDFVINDLTEFPVDKAVKGYGYDLETTSAILELSLKVVKQGGKTLARVRNGSKTYMLQ